MQVEVDGNFSPAKYCRHGLMFALVTRYLRLLGRADGQTVKQEDGVAAAAGCSDSTRWSRARGAVHAAVHGRGRGEGGRGR